MSQVNFNAPSTIRPEELFDTGVSSVQFLFAQLQLQLSQAAKERALEKMDVIQKNQALAREMANMVAQARELQNKAGKGKAEMPEDMKKFFDDHGLKVYDKYTDREKKEAEIKKAEGKYEKTGHWFDKNYLEYLQKRHNDKLADSVKFDKDQWDYNIKSLTNAQEQIGADTQQLMVFIQDFMGQYNAYLSGANNSIRESNQTLAGLVRNQ